MKVIATSTGSGIEPIEAGTYPAICTGVIHVGTIPTEYQGKKGTSNKLRLMFEIPEETWTDDDGNEHPRTISAEYTLSLSEKANLRKHLEAWRGKEFTAEELEGFDILKVLGQGCQLSIVNKTSATGNKYAKISSVIKPRKTDKFGEPETPILIFSYDCNDDELLELFQKLPEWIQKDIKTAKEWIDRDIDVPEQEDDDVEDETTQAAREAAEEKEDKPKKEKKAPAKKNADKPPF